MYLRPLLEMGPSPIFVFLPSFGLSYLSNKVFIPKKKRKKKEGTLKEFFMRMNGEIVSNGV